MIIFDALVWLALAKLAVLVFDDLVSAARGKRSPRLQARDQRRAAEARGTAPASGWGRRTGGAIGDYFAGLVEDAATSARASRRRRAARKQGRRAVDGVLIDLDDDGGWYADCDLCEWSSRRFHLEANARAAGAEHAITHQVHDDEEEDTTTQTTDDEQTQTPRRPWRPRVIPGGAADTPNRSDQTPPPPAASVDPAPAEPAGPASSVVHPGPGQTATAPDAVDPPQALTQADRERLRSELHGKCAHRTVRGEGFLDEYCENPVGADNPYCSQHSSGNTTDAMTSTDETREITIVNLEATGPEEIRAAFQTAIDTATERAEEIGGIAGVLTEAADRYESLKMAPSTVAHIRDAAESFKSAEPSLTTAVEELEAALADFNTRDGAVADTVADTGGNLAGEEVLVS